MRSKATLAVALLGWLQRLNLGGLRNHFAALKGGFLPNSHQNGAERKPFWAKKEGRMKILPNETFVNY
jgi:hypothetical protein